MLNSGSTHTRIAGNIAKEFGLAGEVQTIRYSRINNEGNLSTRWIAFNVTAAHPSDVQFPSH